MIIHFLVLLCVVLMGLYLVARARVRPGSGPSLHEMPAVWAVIYLVGSLVIHVRDGGHAARHLAILAALSLASMLVTVLLLLHTDQIRPPASGEPPRIERTITWIVGVVSAGVCLLFIGAVVRNDELALMLFSVFAGDESALELRKAITSGREGYLAPGYVKQFREVLLPAALVLLIPRTRRWGTLVVAGLGASGLGAALLSGQRFAVLVYLFALGVGVFLRVRVRRGARLVVLTLFGTGGFAAFLAVTVILGRADIDQGTGELIVTGMTNLIDRMVTTVPGENLNGYAVWSQWAPTHGASWMADLSSMLPGVQRGLSGELHQLLGGSEEGNAPLGLPADIYLAWGGVGVVLAPALFLVVLAWCERVLLERSVALGRSLRLVLFPLSFTWYSPFLFLLNGGLVLLATVGWLSMTETTHE